ncbi:hypothetical protein ACTG16_22100 [Aeromonas sp. 23P]|uniref:hypothetical protein n=1 Tax=Aeromonas sp. 23P TaxID=3452716 RepID=UPI003F79DBC7
MSSFVSNSNKVVINDAVYVPAHDSIPNVPFLIKPSQESIIKALKSLYYLIYFDHWHRKNGPISECMEWLCPDLLEMLSDERYDTIKAMVHSDPTQPTTQKQAWSDASSNVTIGGQLFIPAHLIKCQVSEQIGQAIVELCDAYAMNTRVKSPTLEANVMRVFELLAPELHGMIKDGRQHEVYERLDSFQG